MTLVLLLLVNHASSSNSQTVKGPWVPDRGDGTYKNPVLFADYSDPDVIRVGDDFYLTASSFNCIPGLPILHSRDLVNWTIIGHALQRQPPGEIFARPQHGNGVWAPSIRFHDNYFYIYYGDPDFGIYMVKARDPAGPWSDPLLVRPAKGWIDPCPFWDDDGQAYLVHAWANSRSGIKSILTINRMSPDGTRLLDEGTMVFDGRVHHPTIEGPKLYKRNGYYYIFAPAGGVPTGWQTVLRSRNILGPYDDKIVMDRGQTEINGPHQGGWIELKSGESWFLHFQDRGAAGRVVHLEPVIWKNDWPVIGVDADGDGKGEPVANYRKPNIGRDYPIAVPQTNDEFKDRSPGLQWQWHANRREDWYSLVARSGWLRLFATSERPHENLWAASNLLLQKLPAPAFTITTRVDASQLREGERAGLLMMGRDYSYIAARRSSGKLQIVRMTCRDAAKLTAETEQASTAATTETLFLRVTVRNEALSRFSFSFDGKEFQELGDEFVAREGVWIGAKVGLFAVGANAATSRGFVDWEWFRVE
ncbi:MAG TPA: glycoside hydrolase 43 family protein [Pyrinomonadaceae bacterium]|nr:glycoside hydrolase 43 family protein [Pyrinomonadaceae bacterium]